jgi:hypothetical protein
MDSGNCRLLHWIEEREARHAGEQAYFARCDSALEVLDRPSMGARREASVPNRTTQGNAASIENVLPNVRINWTRHMGWLTRRVS